MRKLFRVLAAIGIIASVVWGQDITISSVAELMAFRDTVNSGRDFSGQTITLANDIDLQGSESNQWEPIGWAMTAAPWTVFRFRGTFDGNGKVIRGLYINKPNSDNQGLFGNLGNGGTIRNLGLVDVNVTGNTWVGGLVGSTGDFTGTASIENSYVTGNVEGNNHIAGGLVGSNGARVTITNSYFIGNVAAARAGGLAGINGGTIINSHASGSLTARHISGGLVGDNNGIITNCYASVSVSGDSGGDYFGGLVGLNHGIIEGSHATGNVTHTGSGYGYFGGLAGYNGGNGGTIRNSYATGNVVGNNTNSTVGGLVGGNHSGGQPYDSGIIENSYATGNVTGNVAGGLVGASYPVHSGNWIVNCYAIGTVNGVRANGGLIGEGGDFSIVNSFHKGADNGFGTLVTDAQLRQQSTFSGWDFGATWSIAASANNGYPHLCAGEMTETSAPTCETNGFQTGTCTICGRTRNLSVEKLGHLFNNWEATTAATCRNNGSERRNCTRSDCNHQETRPILAGPNLVNGYDWEAEADTFGSTATTDFDPGYVSFEFNTVTSNASLQRWAWARIITDVEGDWDNFAGIDIAYWSNRDVLIMLEMDDEELTEGGALFRATLQSGSRTRLLTLSDFTQPNWVVGNPQYQRASIDRSLITGISIQNISEGVRTEGGITRLALRGVAVEDCEDICSHAWNDPAWDTTGVSCTTAGTRSRTRTCSLCGEKSPETQEIPALLCVDITDDFTDTNFLAAVYSLIGKTAPAPIFNTDVKDIDSLDLRTINQTRVARSEATISTIRNLSGIEHFVSLEYLNVSGHDLTELDLSSNVNLIHLDVSGNLISELDLSNNTALKELKVEGNRIERMDDIKGLDNTQIDLDNFHIGNQATSIRRRQPTDVRYGIIVAENPVSDMAKINVITPEPATVKLAILDNLGNVVFTTDGVGAGFARPENRTNGDLGGQTPPLQNAIVWDLTNPSGRYVANGAYLIIVEATGISGRRFTYSARIGVNR